MKYRLKTPCKDCPFRKDLPEQLKGWLGKPRAEQLSIDVLKHGSNFPCHKTIHRDDTGHYEYQEKESQCAGAAIMQIKSNHPSQWMQISERIGFDTGSKNLDLDAPVFDTPEDFIKFHSLDD